MASQMRKQAAAWPERLAAVPAAEWPPVRPQRPVRPLELWRSRHYLAQVFGERWLGDIEVRRMSVNRVTVGADAHWEENIPWEDLMRCKREAGYGDWYGVEVYPRDRDIVNMANMRHLWLLREPLAIGWFS